MPEPVNRFIHIREKVLRASSQKEAAQMLGVGAATWCRWETGRHQPSGRQLEELRDALTRLGVTNAANVLLDPLFSA